MQCSRRVVAAVATLCSIRNDEQIIYWQHAALDVFARIYAWHRNHISLSCQTIWPCPIVLLPYYSAIMIVRTRG